MPDYIDRQLEEEVKSGRLSSERANIIMRLCLALPPQQRAQVASILESQPALFPIFIDNLEKKMLAVASDDMDAWRAVVEDEVRQIDNIS